MVSCNQVLTYIYHQPYMAYMSLKLYLFLSFSAAKVLNISHSTKFIMLKIDNFPYCLFCIFNRKITCALTAKGNTLRNLVISVIIL